MTMLSAGGATLLAICVMPSLVHAASLFRAVEHSHPSSWSATGSSFLSKAIATVDKPSSEGGGHANRNRMAYLAAMQQWRRATKRGLQCPAPQSCQCHCDCPDTVMEQPPPPVAPCPVYLTLPTTPPPEMLPPDPTTPPPMPNNAVKVPGFSKPLEFSKKCKAGEVITSTGSCKKVTKDMIQELMKLCFGLKNKLDGVEEMSKAATPQEYVYLKFQLMEANDRYRRALDLLTSVLSNFKEEKADAVEEEAKEEEEEPEEEEKEKKVGPVPEFVLGAVEHRMHCEPWSKNATFYIHNLRTASIDTCAVICRNQPTCVGFNIDPGYGWCIWFDDKEEVPFPQTQCSTQNKTAFIKNKEVHFNSTIWITMEKVRAEDKKWQATLKQADLEAEIANDTFYEFWEEKNNTLKNGLMEKLLEAKTNYSKTMAQAATIKQDYFTESITVFNLIKEERMALPPFPVIHEDPAEEEEEKQIHPLPMQAVATDLKPSPMPGMLEWQDFPNAGDTAWSKMHPECPMGPPCWCDCQCRGSPPQNFIPKPPPPPMPCPPPPLPPPPMGVTPMYR